MKKFKELLRKNLITLKSKYDGYLTAKNSILSFLSILEFFYL